MKNCSIFLISGLIKSFGTMRRFLLIPKIYGYSEIRKLVHPLWSLQGCLMQWRERGCIQRIVEYFEYPSLSGLYIRQVENTDLRVKQIYKYEKGQIS